MLCRWSFQSFINRRLIMPRYFKSHWRKRKWGGADRRCKTVYNWSKRNQLYGDLPARHIRPFVELGLGFRI